MKYRFRKGLGVSAGVLVASAILAPTIDADSPEQIRILHTNDIHASFDHYAKASAYIQDVRQTDDHVLYMDAGDYASGNPVVDLNFGIPMVDVFNAAELDVLTIGNHEFDYGQDHLINNMDSSDFPWLGANVDTLDTGVENPEPYELFDVNGTTVGVLGITQAPPATAPGNVEGMAFESDYAAVANEYQEELEREADVIVALTHIGVNADVALAEDVDYFDLIIGGHSHTTLQEPRVVNGTPILQAGANLSHVGDAVLTLNDGEVTNVEAELISVDTLEEVDENVQPIIDQYNDEMDEILGEVIGYSENGLSRDGRFNGDAPLGNFWTDAMRSLGDADIAFTNNGGIRDSIPSGDVTLNEIYTIEPFANEIMLIEMTGEAIENVLEYSYSRDQRNQIDLQVSGMEYEIVTGMTGNYLDTQMTIDGEPVDEQATYTVAVADYIGTGGSGYEFEGEVISETIGLMTDAMTQWARSLTDAGETLDYEQEGRISITIDPEGPLPGTIIGATETGLYSANKRLQDTGIGNLYTDSLIERTDAEIAMLNGSSVTGQIPPGEITDEQIESLDAFGNEIVLVEATGERIEEMILEQSNYHQGVDLQIAGLNYTLIPAESGNGFDDIHIERVNGEPFIDDEQYTVAYNDFMHANSFYNLGDELDSFGPVWQAVVDFVTDYDGSINYEEGSRISIEGLDVEPDPSGAVSVQEALENNQGIRNVRGYIVGSINNQEVILGEGVHAPSNLLLADDPSETDREKMLPVQLVNNTPVRHGLNLVSHPEHVGEHVTITGELDTYFGTPGMRSPTGYEWVTESGPGPECVYEEWSDQVVYTAGDRVSHEGNTYEAKWWTTGENPTQSGTWDVWQLVKDCQDEEEGVQVWGRRSRIMLEMSFHTKGICMRRNGGPVERNQQIRMSGTFGNGSTVK
ncbi:5'-nucleotidase [Geomicrobium sp. JCM 19037]|nr:5'-nucleotidase [Geomicrobium sp. JCM 19037]